ncbi:hypothetical protein H0R90_06245 [Treponema putidum]
MIFPRNSSWVILSPIEQRIKEKIEKVGVPLKDWDIQINYGIKTGCNEAFIIDKTKRDELIKQSPNSVDIIRPILRGRDIKRYSYDFADTYLLNVHNGIREKDIPPINIDDYPAVKAHLDHYWDKISVRDDRGKTPYNLRNCAYMDDFSKPKICWNRIASKKVFALVDENILIQDSMHFFIGDKLKYLCAMLNSNLFRWFLLLLVGNAAGGNAGNSDNIKNLKLYIPCLKEENRIEKLMEYKNYKEIDNYIYDLYKLTKEEINLVEVYTSSN